jgi:hypothetical protein
LEGHALADDVVAVAAFAQGLLDAGEAARSRQTTKSPLT